MNIARRYLVFIFLIILVQQSASASPSALKKRLHQGGRENEFIVILPETTPTSSVEPIARALADKYGVHITRLWPFAVKGFLCNGPGKALDELAQDPAIEYIEQNLVTRGAPHPQSQGTPMPQQFISGTQNTYYDWNCRADHPLITHRPVSPGNPTGCTPSYRYLWSLDRVDQLSWSQRDGLYNMCPEGRSVYAYMIDMGVWKGHPEFENPSRVVTNLDFSSDRTDQAAVYTQDATNGCLDIADVLHGTAVASVIGGTHIGAAKPQIVSLKVYNCQRGLNVQAFIDALDWIASPSNMQRNQPGVISFSSYAPPWDTAHFASLGDAAERTVAATNFPLFTSADNWSTNACLFSPKDRAYTNVSKSGKVFVAGGTNVSSNASDPNDYRWQTYESDGSLNRGNGSGSNAGSCVSIYAPAVGIYVAQNYSADWRQYGTYDGTSFAAPLVAGIAARYIERQRLQGPTPTYSEVYDFLLSQATTGIQSETTTPTYWVCVNVLPDNSFFPGYFTANPGVCPAGYNRGPFEFNQAANSSSAKVLYWNNGSCP